MEKAQKKIKNNKIVFYITYAIVLAFVLFNLTQVLDVVIYILGLATPFYIAIIIAYILNIPMRKIEHLLLKVTKEKKGLCRGLAIALTIFIVLIIVGLFSSFIIPNLVDSITLIFNNLMNYTYRIVNLINDLAMRFHINYSISATSVESWFASADINALITKAGNFLGTSGVNILTSSIGIVGSAIGTITSFMMSLYLLANKERHIAQVRKFIAYIFGYQKSITIFEIGSEANHYFNGFVSGQLLESFIFMSMIYLGMRVFNLPFPELIGCIVFICSFVPMFGAFISFAIGFILVLAAQSSSALIYAVMFLVLQQIEGNIIYPRVVGNAVGISGLFVLIGLTVFGNLFGFFGLLIAVPTTALLYAVLSRIINIHLYRNHIEVTHDHMHRLDDQGNHIE